MEKFYGEVFSRLQKHIRTIEKKQGAWMFTLIISGVIMNMNNALIIENTPPLTSLVQGGGVGRMYFFVNMYMNLVIAQLINGTKIKVIIEIVGLWKTFDNSPRDPCVVTLTHTALVKAAINPDVKNE